MGWSFLLEMNKWMEWEIAKRDWTLIFVFLGSSKIESTSSRLKLLSEQWLSNWMDLKAISQQRWSLQDKLPCRNHDTSCCMIYLATIMIRLNLTISYRLHFLELVPGTIGRICFGILILDAFPRTYFKLGSRDIFQFTEYVVEKKLPFN